MKPALHDFDVITDAPAPKRHPPEPAEHPAQQDTAAERRSAAVQQKDAERNPRAAE